MRPSQTWTTAAALLVAAAPSSAAVLNFDTITTNAVESFSNYGGFQWASGLNTAPGWAAVDIDQECPPCSPTGFRDGRTSGAYIADQYYNYTATITSPQAFSMTSVQLSSAWRDNLSVQFGGYLGGQLVWTSTEVVGRTATLVMFNQSLIDELRVFSFGGGQPSGGGTSAGAVFDDFTFNTATPTNGVPEPATWAMLLAGFGLIGSAVRRRTTARPAMA